ncbi:TatD DNase family protein [Elusimicrobium simillimum]|uniref:TatD family hydrolase n=1 Tax=Elusimicrobium simillimum TaxID=3143438 RepID=UPI003C6FFB7A
MNIHLIDSHAHMTDPAFDADRDAVIEACVKNGVKNILEIGCDVPEWEPTLELAAKYKGIVYPVLGLHPSCGSNYSEDVLARLADLIVRPEVVAIGEIGLDYVHMSTAAEAQKEIFTNILGFTKTVNKPIVLHARKNNDPEDWGVYGDMFSILKSSWMPGKTGGVLHCFSGLYEHAAAALDMGLKLGINGIITYKKNNDLRETLKKVGLKNILLETDCPYLPPQSIRGQRNSPLSIPEIATFIADYLGVTVAQVADTTTENSKKMFGI